MSLYPWTSSAEGFFSQGGTKSGFSRGLTGFWHTALVKQTHFCVQFNVLWSQNGNIQRLHTWKNLNIMFFPILKIIFHECDCSSNQSPFQVSWKCSAFERIFKAFESNFAILGQCFAYVWRFVSSSEWVSDKEADLFAGLIGRSAKLVVQDQMMHEELREKLFALMNEVRPLQFIWINPKTSEQLPAISALTGI